MAKRDASNSSPRTEGPGGRKRAARKRASPSRAPSTDGERPAQASSDARRGSSGSGAEEQQLLLEQLLGAQVSLEQVLQRYVELFDSAPIPYATLDESGVIRDINLAGAALIGRARASLQGTPFFLRVAMRDRQVFLDHLRRAREASGSVSVELTLVGEDRREIPVQLCSDQARVLYDERPLLRTALVDLTPRREAEREREQLVDELANERRQLLEILRQVPSGVMLMEAQNQTVVFVNPKCESILRLEGPLPRPFGELRRWRTFRLDGEEYAQDDLPLLRAARTGERSTDELVVLRHEDGRTQYLSVNTAAIRDEHGRIVAAIAAFDDITARRRSEDEFRRLNLLLEQRVEERTVYLQVLLDAAVIGNSAESVAAALQQTLKMVCERLGWIAGHAWLRQVDGESFVDSGLWHSAERERVQGLAVASARLRFAPGESLAGDVVLARSPRWITHLEREKTFRRRAEAAAAGLCCAIAIPIVLRDHVEGVLEFFHAETIEPDETLLAVLAQVGVQLGRLLERKATERQVADMVEHEQRRIGSELHDSLGQQLTGAAMLAASLRKRLEAAGSPEAERAALLARTVDEARAQSRLLARGLLPVELDADGLRIALAQLARDTEALCAVPCSFECDEPVPVHDSFTATHLYRIAQEALTNAVRHAQPKNIVLSLDKRQGARVWLGIEDDGNGVGDDPSSAEGSGLRMMRYRAGLIGARLEIASSERGTSVNCILR